MECKVSLTASETALPTVSARACRSRWLRVVRLVPSRSKLAARARPPGSNNLRQVRMKISCHRTCWESSELRVNDFGSSLAKHANRTRRRYRVQLGRSSVNHTQSSRYSLLFWLILAGDNPYRFA